MVSEPTAQIGPETGAGAVSLTPFTGVGPLPQG